VGTSLLDSTNRSITQNSSSPPDPKTVSSISRRRLLTASVGGNVFKSFSMRSARSSTPAPRSMSRTSLTTSSTQKASTRVPRGGEEREGRKNKGVPCTLHQRSHASPLPQAIMLPSNNISDARVRVCVWRIRTDPKKKSEAEIPWDQMKRSVYP